MKKDELSPDLWRMTVAFWEYAVNASTQLFPNLMGVARAIGCEHTGNLSLWSPRVTLCFYTCEWASNLSHLELWHQPRYWLLSKGLPGSSPSTPTTLSLTESTGDVSLLYLSGLRDKLIPDGQDKPAKAGIVTCADTGSYFILWYGMVFLMNNQLLLWCSLYNWTCYWNQVLSNQ